VYRFRISVDIDAPPAHVWRALCDPNEVVRWDAGVVEARDAPADYPRPGQTVRWRCRGGPFRVLVDRPREVVRERVLRSFLSVGPYRLDETYVLAHRDGGSALVAEVEVGVALPLIGGILADRYAGPRFESDFAASLAALKRHCEASAS